MKKLKVLLLLVLCLLLFPAKALAKEMPECDSVYSVEPQFSNDGKDNYFIFDVGNQNDLYVKIYSPFRSRGSIELYGTDIKDEFTEDDFYSTGDTLIRYWLLYHIGPITDDAVHNGEIAIKFSINNESRVYVMQVKNKKDNISTDKKGDIQIKVETEKLPEVIEYKKYVEELSSTPAPSTTPKPSQSPATPTSSPKPSSTPQSSSKPSSSSSSSKPQSPSSSSKDPLGYQTKVAPVIKTFGIKSNGVVHATAKAKTDKLLWRIKSLRSGKTWTYTGTKKFSTVMDNEKVAYMLSVSEDGKVWSNTKVVMPFATIKSVKGRKVTWRKVDTARTYQVLIKTKTKKGYKIYKETKKRSIKLKRSATICIRAKSRLYASKMKDGCFWVVVK